MKDRHIVGIFALVVFFFCMVFDSLLAMGSGTTLAIVAGGMWNEDNQVFRRNLETTVGKRIWWKSKLSELMSIIDYDKYKKTGAYGSVKDSRLPTEAIIHVVRDFKSKKGVKLDMPILNPLTAQGRTGTQTLENMGEARKLFNTEVGINMKRHAMLVRDNEMSEWTLNPAIAKVLMARDGDDLQDWFSRYVGFEAWFAIFEGYSRNLTDGDNGTGYSKKSHPNFAVQSDGIVDFLSDDGGSGHVANTFDTGWEILCATAIATLSATAADYFDSVSLTNMAYIARQKKIQPINVGGKEYFIVFIQSAQAVQLRRDSAWIDYYKQAGVRGDSNPLFTGALEGYPFEGTYVIVDDTIPAGRVTGETGFYDGLSSNGASTGICYHNADSATTMNYMDVPRDASPRKAAVLMGQGAIYFAEGKGFALTEEVRDHGQKIEVGGTMIMGAARPDVIDTENYLGNGANTFVENASSLIYWTYSPDSITI